MLRSIALIIGREDLCNASKTKPIDEITAIDIQNDVKLQKENLVLFIDDDDGKTKILKNRYGSNDFRTP